MRNYYENPIIFGEHADPSILCEGKDYYMVFSNCFGNYKMMPMWHSTDLLDWEPIYYVLEGTDIENCWAPELIKYKDKYYIYNFAPKRGTFVVTCDDIKKGNWSKPVFLPEAEGIDPGHVVGEDGKRYLAMSNNTMYPLSEDGLKVTGESIKLCEDYVIPDGRNVEGLCTESPKFFKRGEYIYYTVAIGGTEGPATSHGVVTYRSKSVKGPYELSPYNPVMSTESKVEKWWSKGHGTIFEGNDKNWYMVYHAIENAHRYTGRIAQLVPITWDDHGWFYVATDDAGKIPCNYYAKKKDLTSYLQYNKGDKDLSLLYNCCYKSFVEDSEFTDKGIVINCSKAEPSMEDMVTFNQQSHHFSVDVTFKTEAESAVCLGFWFRESMNCGIYVKGKEMGLLKHGGFPLKKFNKSIGSNEATLRMVCDHGTISYYYKTKADKDFIKNISGFEVSDWNPNVCDGFGYARANIQAFGKGKVIIEKIEYKDL